MYITVEQSGGEVYSVCTWQYSGGDVYLVCMSYGNKYGTHRSQLLLWHGCLLLKISRRLLQVVW